MTSKSKFKQTEIGKIPEDWKLTTFSEAVSVNPKRELKKGVEAKFISMSNINVFDKKIRGYIIRKFSGGSKFINGDTLMARITPCLENGKTAYVDFLERNEAACGSTEFVVLAAKEGKTSPQFVYYLATSPTVRVGAIKAMSGTSGRQRVEADFFDRFEICLPPIPEQQSIAAILSSLDEKIELNQQMSKTLEAVGQAIFKHWFADFEFPNEDGKPYRSSGGEMVESELGEIPKGWKVSKVGKELKTLLGGTPDTQNKDYWVGGTIPWINSGKINEFRIIEPTKHITQAGLDNSATKMFLKRTTVIAITGATLGQVSLLEISSCANQSVVGVCQSEKIPAEYIYFWIREHIMGLLSLQTGGAQQHINKEGVNDTLILLPSDYIMQNYLKIVSGLFNKITSNCFESFNLSRIRDSLLPKLMSGKVRVNVVR